MTVVPFQVISQVSRQVRGVYFPGWGKWGVGTGLKQRRTQFSWKDVRVVWCKGWGKLNTPDSEGSRRKASWWPVLDHFKRLFTFLASTSGTCSLGSDHWIQNNPAYLWALTVRSGESKVHPCPSKEGALRLSKVNCCTHGQRGSSYLLKVMRLVSGGAVPLTGHLLLSPMHSELHHIIQWTS